MPERSVRVNGVPAGLSRETYYRAALRFIAFFGLWLVLMHSLLIADLVFGACAAALATWASLKLAPPASGTLRIGGMLLLLPHFLWQSVRAGMDVSRRVLAPRLALEPGFVSCPLDFPPGLARNSFKSVTSLLPGTLPCGEVADGCLYHCLDTSQPVVRQLRDEQRRFAGAFVPGGDHV